MALLQIQPFRGIYLTYHFFSTVFIRIPLWILLAIPKSWRPRATWSISRTVKLKLTRYLTALSGTAGPLFGTPPNHLAITPGVNVNGVWIPPIPELIKDELAIWANVAQVTSIRIPGYWLHKEGSSITVAAPLMPGEKVVYALHGGGYVRLSAHPTDPTSNIARGLINHVGCVHRVFSTEYRLSSLKSKEPNPFPAALIDALAGYVYLVKTVGLDPSDIIVEGDSAGGNLALALTRYLVEHPDSGLPPPPGALILLSVWADLGPQALNPNSSWMNHAKSDYIGLTDVKGYYKTVRTFVGPHGLVAAETNPMISPASLNPAMKIHFKGFPRTFIAAGGAEVFYDMICALKDKMVADLGEGDGVRPGDGKIKFYVAADAAHDWVALPKYEPERTETLEAIAAWVNA